MPLNVVFDTNILISAAGWNGPPRKCVQLAREGYVNGAVCTELLLEYAEKLETVLAFPRFTADEAVIELLSFLRLVDIYGAIRGVARDPDDDMILDCAVTAGAGYIVSGDKDLLVLGQFREIKVVKAAEFLEIVAKQ